jgi:hypothetical protein
MDGRTVLPTHVLANSSEFSQKFPKV